MGAVVPPILTAGLGGSMYSIPLADLDALKVLRVNAAGDAWEMATLSAGVTDHAALSNLSYAASGHTGFAATSHTHAAADVTSGVLGTARLGTGTADNTTYLRGDSTWQTISGGTPGGSDTQVQFNDGGAFGGDAGLTYNKTTDALTLVGALIGKSAAFVGTADNRVRVGSTGVAGATYTGFELSNGVSFKGGLFLPLNNQNDNQWIAPDGTPAVTVTSGGTVSLGGALTGTSALFVGPANTFLLALRPASSGFTGVSLQNSAGVPHGLFGYNPSVDRSFFQVTTGDTFDFLTNDGDVTALRLSGTAATFGVPIVGTSATFSETVRVGNYTVATLPTPAAGLKGAHGFATDGRAGAEGVGAGTGVTVACNGSAWKRFEDWATVAA